MTHPHQHLDQTSRHESRPERISGAQTGPNTDSLAAFDVTKMFTSMFELGAGMLQIQQQMFATLLGATNPHSRDMNAQDTDRREITARNPSSRDSGRSQTSDRKTSDFDNWVRPVTQVAVAPRAEEISRSPQASSDFDNWIRAEWEAMIAARAESISRSRPMGDDVENWLQAEREIKAERELIAARAREVAASPSEQEKLDTWLRAERELTAAGRIAYA
jgi:hypothetical protein